ncbi:hypothetical protein B0H14DRAFT_3437617 [Mycena olivaceomarginata]|nr:hypothetical protein B0H14DRAFT_3437617 [Mycena olivaceomarginata]
MQALFSLDLQFSHHSELTPQPSRSQDPPQDLELQDASRPQDARRDLAPQDFSGILLKTQNLNTRARSSRLKTCAKSLPLKTPQDASQDPAPQDLSGRLLKTRAKSSRLKTLQEPLTRVKVSRLKTSVGDCSRRAPNVAPQDLSGRLLKTRLKTRYFFRR